MTFFWQNPMPVWGRARKLHPKLIEVFREDLAYAQRGDPEEAMTHAQLALGGGVLSYVIEHVGDLTNRMAKDITWDNVGYGYVKTKTKVSLDTLKNPYGFEREHRENVENNARRRGEDLATYQKKIDAALKAYADAHAKLPVFNRPQQLARDASVALGRGDYARATRLLERLQKTYIDPGEPHFWEAATEYDPDVATVAIAGVGEPRRR